MIYEGTNTIQSLDLLGRKVLADNGARLKKFGRLVRDFVEEEGVDEAMQEFVNPLADLGEKVTKLTTEIGMKAFQNADEVGAAAVDYLRVCGHLVFAYSGPAWPRWRSPRPTPAIPSTRPSSPPRGSTSPSCCPRRRR
jgi:hypothetical protein